MNDINVVIATGVLYRDPENLSFKDSNKTVSKLLIVAEKTFSKKDSSEATIKSFIHIEAWGAEGKKVALSHKGDRIWVSGELSTHSWVGEEDGKKHYKTYVNANEIEVISAQDCDTPKSTPVTENEGGVEW